MKVEITRWKTNSKEDKWRKGSIKKKEIHIDGHDSWSVAWSLAQIAAPLVKQLKATSHGYGSVPKQLVPDHLHLTYGSEEEHMEGYSKEAWDWALDEIVFAMEEIANDNANEPSPYTKVGEVVFSDSETEEGWGTLDFKDFESTPESKAAYEEYHNRIQKGCELFGVLFQSLWD